MTEIYSPPQNPRDVADVEEPNLNQIAAADGLVFALLGMMFLSLLIIGSLIFCMKRNASRRDPDVDDLLEEVAETERQERQQKQTPAIADGPAAEPWERPGDWWKDQ